MLGFAAAGFSSIQLAANSLIPRAWIVLGSAAGADAEDAWLAGVFVSVRGDAETMLGAVDGVGVERGPDTAASDDGDAHVATREQLRVGDGDLVRDESYV